MTQMRDSHAEYVILLRFVYQKYRFLVATYVIECYGSAVPVMPVKHYSVAPTRTFLLRKSSESFSPESSSTDVY